MTTKEILQGALALFGPDGERWGTIDNIGIEGRQCVRTAMMKVGNQWNGEKIAGYKLLGDVTGTSYLKIETWNDRSTWPEVKAAFERAIELA